MIQHGKKSILRGESRTIEAMIELYCHDHHGTDQALCSECAALLEYAVSRLKSCPFQPEKPVCSRCPVHCYTKDMRHGIRTVMKYAGPRMFYRHPVLAIAHLIRSRKKPPGK